MQSTKSKHQRYPKLLRFIFYIFKHLNIITTFDKKHIHIFVFYHIVFEGEGEDRVSDTLIQSPNCALMIEIFSNGKHTTTILNGSNIIQFSTTTTT